MFLSVHDSTRSGFTHRTVGEVCMIWHKMWPISWETVELVINVLTAQAYLSLFLWHSCTLACTLDMKITKSQDDYLDAEFFRCETPNLLHLSRERFFNKSVQHWKSLFLFDINRCSLIHSIIPSVLSLCLS